MKGRIAAIICAFVVVSLCVAWSVTKAYSPPPDQKYRGPSMVGTLTMTPDPDNGEVLFTFTGRCGGTEPNATESRRCSTAFFSDISVESLEEFIFECPLSLQECYPGGVTPIAIDILNVIRYDEVLNNGNRTMVIADVVMMWVI